MLRALVKALEATQAFHAKRLLTKGDKEVCAVVAEALASGSDEASKALEVCKYKTRVFTGVVESNGKRSSIRYMLLPARLSVR